jgi:hypothetical protein
MPINDPNAQPLLRKPRLRAVVQGKTIPTLVQFEVMNNNYYQSDTFSAQFSLYLDPEFGISWWGGQTEILLDLQSSVDDGQTWVSHILGQVDHVNAILEKGVISLEGRDLTARFIDNKTQETYLNRTASQVVEELAAKRGLTADVTPTTTPVGRYYEAQHDRLSMDQFVRTTTEWNLLCSLAQNEGFDIWVTGTTVHFHPSTPPDSDPFVVIFNERPYSSNVSSISLERSLTVAKDVIVAVRSWNSMHAREITKYAPTGARYGSIQSGKAQQFSVVRPNLTEQQAQELANKLREDITRNERILTFRCPADQTLSARNMVRFQGTSSSWDSSGENPYYVDWVRRRLSLREGFTMEVRCKNHSAQTTVLAT